MAWYHVILILPFYTTTSLQNGHMFSLNSTFNLVKHLKSISASDECGNKGAELYCLLTGTPLAPGLDYTYSRYPGSYVDGQFCNTCQPKQHKIRNTIDENENNWWQSSSLANIDSQQMTIDLDLGQEYQAVYFVLKAANSPRPARWVLEKSIDGGKTFTPWQIYVPTDADCEKYYNISASHFPVAFTADDQVICTSYYSTLNPLENGQIYTSLVNGRPGAEFFYLNESPRLQEWMKATNVRLRLEQMQVLHNLIHEEDDTANRRFFYSIREIIVAGRCSCNGHASYCEQWEGRRELHCKCEGNTCGANCDTCCPGYNVFPWQPSSAAQHFQCEACQCFGHSEDCYYDSKAEGKSVDINGSVRGGGVCNNCSDNTEGLNCERCTEGYYRGARETLFDKTCRKCECNTANIQLVPGLEFGSCNQSDAGQCYCKPQYGGRTCNECRGDHYNSLVRGLDCKLCGCDIHGTVSQLQNCDHVTGTCLCKDKVLGSKCDTCRDETFNKTLDNEYGCADCSCNIGGSMNNNCDKQTGQCECKPGLIGRQCNLVQRKHYIPSTDFLALEAEDGKMHGRDALYDYNEGVFKEGFNGRGYATINSYAPSVDMKVEVPQYSRYKVRVTYQLEESFETYTGYITAKQEGSSSAQRHAVTLQTCADGCDVTVQQCSSGKCSEVAVVLTPGSWTITFSYNAPALNLDRVVLIPRAFDQPDITHSNLTSCTLSKQSLCEEYQLPNLEPYIHRSKEFSQNTTTFDVEDTSKHSLVVDFLYNSTDILNPTLTISDGNVTKTGYFILHHCDELQMCRSIVRDSVGKPLVYSTVPSNLTVTFDQHLPGSNSVTGEMYLVKYREDLLFALKPQYICMRGVNGRCTLNTFPVAYPSTSRPAYKGFIETRAFTDQGEVNTTRHSVTDKYIQDRSNYDKLTDVCGSKDAVFGVKLVLVGSPATYRFIVEYFYTGLEPLRIEVTFSDSKSLVGQGFVTFAPCNGYSACRTLVVNTKSTSNLYTTPYFRLRSRNVIAQFVDFPVGKCVLLNTITTTGSRLPSSSLITPIPLSRTEEYLSTCNSANYSANTTDKQFCDDAHLTVAAEFFNGLPPCGCNMEGSLREECEVQGGQCHCKPNIIGRTCDRCKAGYFGFPDCQPCPEARCSVAGNGFSSICNEKSGKCECAPNVVGAKCGQCDADSYDYDGLLGCKDCDCNTLGSSGVGCNEGGACFCKNSTITGQKCDECVLGTTNFPSCEPCGCDKAGSSGVTCNTVTGKCPCKAHTRGLLCDSCEFGYYDLKTNNTEGCTKCFCFGVTDNCTSATMAYDKIGREFEENDAQGWVVVDADTMRNTIKPIIAESTRYPGLYELVVDFFDTQIILKTSNFLWLSPYKGDLTYSYGGALEFTLGYFPTDKHPALFDPVIYIMGTHGVIHKELRKPSVDSYVTYDVTLAEGQWVDTYTLKTVSKADIMAVLVDVMSISIRGDLSDQPATYRLMSVSLDSAFLSTNGLTKVTHIEQCYCPEGYTGTSCQECTTGYYRVQNETSVLGMCVPCNCNGHSDTCDVHTGVCVECADNTEGEHCNTCKEQYYGDPTNGRSCQLCPCPLPLAGNVFGSCSYNSSLSTPLSCECEAGYEGVDCGACSAGYHGNPKIPGHTCGMCSTCNSNTDTNQDYCDRQTGNCILCLDHTAGDQCEECAAGYYGDAVHAKNCRKCQCDAQGSVDGVCDRITGQCHCLPNVQGQNCDSCDIGHWDLSDGVGCTSCGCNVNGTRLGQCNEITGQCSCEDGVAGFKCDECQDQYYGLSELGHCTKCDCNEFGSTSEVCDKVTGQCNCTAATTGQRCDICDNWAIITNTGCLECAGCSKILKDFIDELATDISDTIKLKEKGGRINEDIDMLIEMKNTAILTKQAALKTISSIEFNKGVWGTDYPLKSGSVRYKYNKLSDYLDNNLVDRLEQIEDRIREEEGGLQQVQDTAAQHNTTYYNILQHLQQSTDILSDIKITNTEPAVIKQAITNSKNNIKKMRNKVIFKVQQSMLDEMNTLNSTVFASLGSLAQTNLSAIDAEISKLSRGMDSVLNNTVELILKPIDNFNFVSDSITGDLSISMGTFNSRKKNVENKIHDLNNTVETMMESSRNISEILSSTETIQYEYFNDTQISTNLTKTLDQELTTNNNYLASKVDFDWDYKIVGIKSQCSIVGNFISAPNTKVKIINDLRKFNNDSGHLEEMITETKVKADQINTAIEKWSGKELDSRVQKRNDITYLSSELSTTYTSLEAKIAAGDIQKRLKDNQDANQKYTDWLNSVKSQMKHDRSKRYASRISVDQFGVSSDELSKKIKKMNKASQNAKKLINVKESEKNLATLQSLEKSNNENFKTISRLFDKDSKYSLKSKIDLIKSKPSLSLAEKMKGLEERMAIIKQKVEKSKNLVSSVQVGVEMTQSSYLSLPMPVVAQENSRYTSISMLVKTEKPSSSLVFLGSSISPDMLQVKLVNKNVQLVFNNGDESTTVKTDVDIADGKWHTIRVSRNGKFGYVSIDSGNGNVRSFSGHNGGSLDMLSLDTSGYFYIGASKETINSANAGDRFEGSLTQLRINNELIGLWNYIDSGRNLKPTQAVVKYSQFSKAPRNGLCLKGWGYAVYSGIGMTIKPNETTKIQTKFQTFDRDGVLFQLKNYNKSESLTVYLVEGNIGVETTLTTGSEKFFLEELVSTGLVVDLTLQISGNDLSLKYDIKNNLLEKTETFKLKKTMNWLADDNKMLYVGGTQNNSDYKSLSGIIKSMSVNDIRLSLQQKDAMEYRGMGNYCLPPKSLDGITLFGYGYAKYKPISFGMNFRLDIKIRTTQPYGVIVLASDALGFNAVSLSLEDGQVIFVAMKEYEKTAVRAGHSVSDGKWHDISLLRNSKTITMNMDGYTSNTNLRENVEYPINHSLYVGGISPDLPLLLDLVPTLLPFEGAIRSFTINGETIDLNDYVEAQDVNIVGTTLKHSDKSYHTLN